MPRANRWCRAHGARISAPTCRSARSSTAVCAAPTTIGRSIATGMCANIPTGDRIPSAARIFTYPSGRAWGLIWAFNGECADFPVPRIPGAEEADDRLRSARARPSRRGTPGSRCPTASISSTCAPCTGCRRARCPSGWRSSRRHRVPGRKPIPSAARTYQRHQCLRATSADRAATTCSCCSAAPRSSRLLVRLFRHRGSQRIEPKSCPPCMPWSTN